MTTPAPYRLNSAGEMVSGGDTVPTKPRQYRARTSRGPEPKYPGRYAKPRSAKARIPKCHPEKKYGAHGLCTTCYNRWYRKNTNFTRVRYQKFRLQNIEAARWFHIRKTFGLNKEEYLALLAAQGGECATCHTKITVAETGQRVKGQKVASLDHCHKTNALRGFLCAGCNKAIGMIADR